MEFAYPQFLFALAAIAIPILIHLFNFRKYKKVYFSNVKFLKEVQQKTKSQSKLKHLLVLLCRILAIAFLVFAFAQPFIPANENVKLGAKAISIYLDNSQSMQSENENGELIETAKNQVADLVGNFNPTDRFQLLTNEFEGYQQRLLSREELLEAVDQVKITSETRDIKQVMSRQQDVLQKSDFAEKRMVWISDFQQSTSQLENIKLDTSVFVNLIPLSSSEPNNVWIDSIWFETPVRILNQAEKLNVRIRNSGNKDLEAMPLALEANGSQIASGSYGVAANSYVDTVMSFTNKKPGIFNAKLKLNDFPVSFDDEYFFTYEVAAQINVLEIKGRNAGNEFDRLFGDDAFYKFTQSTASAIDYAAFSANELIVLNQLNNYSSGLISELAKFAENGGSIVYIPSNNPVIAENNELLLALNGNSIKTKVAKAMDVNYFNFKHPIYANVFEKIPRNLDLPKTQHHFSWNRRIQSTEQVLMRLQSGQSFLSLFKKGKGKFYAFGTDLNQSSTNFSAHALFVTTLLRIAESSKETGIMAYNIGDNSVIEIAAATNLGEDDVYKFKLKEAEFDFVPAFQNNGKTIKVYVGDQINIAGNYNLFAGETQTLGLGFNYDRKESYLTSYSAAELKELMAANGASNFSVLESKEGIISDNIVELEKDIKYWKYCILLALLFIAFETLLLRFWKS